MSSELSDKEIKANILFKLFRLKTIGGKHTDIIHLYKSFEQRQLGKKGQKRVKDLVDEMIKESLLMPKPAKYGLHISINPRQIEKTKQIIKEVYRDFEE